MKPPFSKFSSYRPFQEETINKIMDELYSGKKAVFLDGPPGTGKSLIGMSICTAFKKALYLCTTKPLQDQLQNDFPEFPILKGRSNYPCLRDEYTSKAFPQFTCDDCMNVLDEGEEERGDCEEYCLYLEAKKEAYNSSLCILNTSYFVAETNFVGQFAGVDMVVVDECDRLEGELLNFVEVKFSDKMVERLRISLPLYKTKWESWKDWVGPTKIKIQHEYEKLILKFKNKPDLFRNNPDQRKYFKLVKTFANKISMFDKSVDKSWIYEEKVGNYSFKPVWLFDVCKPYFWDRGKQFVLMSGTPPLPKLLGLDQREWGWVECGGHFPSERRPVYYTGTANITRKTVMEEREKLIPEIKDILLKYPESKGLIHTVSYTLSQYIIDNINTRRLVTHQPGGRNREDLLRMFKASKDPLVMVSPSMERGIDLPYDQCRFIICVKVPFPDLGDKQINQRVYSSRFGQTWYSWMACASIIQMSMRGMRAVDDSVDTWILDKQFVALYKKNFQYFPEWWRKSLDVRSVSS